MNCLSCNTQLIWQNDFMCDDVYDCNCEEGIISYQYCYECEKLFTYTTDCHNIPTGLEEV